MLKLAKKQNTAEVPESHRLPDAVFRQLVEDVPVNVMVCDIEDSRSRMPMRRP